MAVFSISGKPAECPMRTLALICDKWTLTKTSEGWSVHCEVEDEIKSDQEYNDEEGRIVRGETDYWKLWIQGCTTSIGSFVESIPQDCQDQESEHAIKEAITKETASMRAHTDVRWELRSRDGQITYTRVAPLPDIVFRYESEQQDSCQDVEMQ